MIYMTIGSRQKEELMTEIHTELRILVKDLGPIAHSVDLKSRHKVSNRITGLTNTLVNLFLGIPDNHGPLGQIRGYIREQRNEISHLVKSEHPDITPERLANIGLEDAYSAYQTILSGTKLLMNGDNPMNPPICQFEDPEETQDGHIFYCQEVCGFGFTYCYDHWQIVRARAENGENDESD